MTNGLPTENLSMFETIAIILALLILVKFSYRAGAEASRKNEELQRQYDEAQQQLKRLDKLLADIDEHGPPPRDKEGNVVEFKPR